MSKDEVFQAAIKGDVALLQKLFKEGVDLNCKDSEENSPLHVATKAGQLGVVEFLLEQRVDVDSRNNEEVTPLHYSCEKGKEVIVNALLKSGVSINLHDSEGLTALHYACKYGIQIMNDTMEYLVPQSHLIGSFERIASQLILQGADVNKQCDEGGTPLHYACFSSNIQLIKVLLTNGADVNIDDHEGFTVLHAACVRGCLSIVKELIHCGMDVHKTDECGATALHFACENGHLDVASFLIKPEVIVDEEFVDSHARFSGDTIEVDNGADINKQCDEGRTPLHYACCSTNTQLVTYLLDRGANVHIEDRNGFSPLHTACKHGRLSISGVKELIHAGLDIHRTDDDGRTGLHIACIYGNRDLAAFLMKPELRVHEGFVCNDNITVEKRLGINKQCDRGRTPLHYACCSYTTENTQLVKDLLESGADVHIEDHDGSTALHTACNYGMLSTVKELIHAGSDIHKTDSAGRTPLHIAQAIPHTNRQKIISLLIMSGASVVSCNEWYEEKLLPCSFSPQHHGFPIDWDFFRSENGNNKIEDGSCLKTAAGDS